MSLPRGEVCSYCNASCHSQGLCTKQEEQAQRSLNEYPSFKAFSQAERSQAVINGSAASQSTGPVMQHRPSKSLTRSGPHTTPRLNQWKYPATGIQADLGALEGLLNSTPTGSANSIGNIYIRHSIPQTNPHADPNPYGGYVLPCLASNGSASTFGNNNTFPARDSFSSANTGHRSASPVMNEYNNIDNCRASAVKNEHNAGNGTIFNCRNSNGSDYNQRLLTPANQYGSAPGINQVSYGMEGQQPLPQVNAQGMGATGFSFTDYLDSNSTTSHTKYGPSSVTSGHAASSVNGSQFSPFVPLLPRPQGMGLSSNGQGAVGGGVNLAYANPNMGSFGRNQGNVNLQNANQGWAPGINPVHNYQIPAAPSLAIHAFKMVPMPAPPRVEDFQHAPHLGVMMMKTWSQQLQNYSFILEQHATLLQAVVDLPATRGGKFVWSPDGSFSATIQMPRTGENQALMNKALFAGNLAIRNSIHTRQFGTLLNATYKQITNVPAGGLEQGGGLGQYIQPQWDPVATADLMGRDTVFNSISNIIEQRQQAMLNGAIGPMPMPPAVPGEVVFDNGTPNETPVRGSGRGRGRGGSGRGGASRGGSSTAPKKKAAGKRKATARNSNDDDDDSTMGAGTGSSAVKAPASRKRASAKKIKSEPAVEENYNMAAPSPELANNAPIALDHAAAMDDPERDAEGEVDDDYVFNFEHHLVSRIH